MSKNRHQMTASRPRPVAAPTAPAPSAGRRWPWALGALVVLAGVVIAWVWLWPAPAPTSDQQLCDEFVRLKNDGDARANDLLGPAPVVPTEPVGEAEADRLDAEIILRRPFRVREARPLPTPSGKSRRFVLWLNGGVASETYPVRTADGKLETGQRFLNNPDVIVEVRDGKIRGVKAQLHEDAPRRGS
jgi:hypothetical protein